MVTLLSGKSSGVGCHCLLQHHESVTSQILWVYLCCRELCDLEVDTMAILQMSISEMGKRPNSFEGRGVQCACLIALFQATSDYYLSQHQVLFQ